MIHPSRFVLLAAALLVADCSDTTPAAPDAAVLDASLDSSLDSSLDAGPDAGDPTKALFDPAKYVAAMRKVLAGAWDEPRLKAEIDRIEKLIGAVAIKDPLLKANPQGVTFAAAVKAVRDFVTNRRAQIKPVIDNPPAWNLPLRVKSCEDKERFSTAEGAGTFATTFGSAGSDPFTAGSGTLTVAVNGKPITALKVGAVVGVDADHPGRVNLFVIAQTSATDNVIAGFNISSTDLVQGATIHLPGLRGVLWQQDTKSGKTSELGGLMTGSLILTKASSTKGEAVEGTFAAKWARKN